MKKKILLLFAMVLCLVGLTGCGSSSDNRETLSYKDEKLKLTTTFKYNKEDEFEFIKNVSGGKYAEIEFRNKKENLYFDMYYTEMSKTQTETIKEDRSNQKYYKKYKFGDYDAYVYSQYESDLYLIIKLREKDDVVTELFVSIELEEFDKDAVVFDIFNKDIINNFFNSIKTTEE